MTLLDLARSDLLPHHIATQLLTESTDDAFARQHAGLWRALNVLALSAGFIVSNRQPHLDEA